ncbi:MAG: protein-L-isoaspartate(D-aspartate) O-methyltransferase [Candidatus Nanohaloarchaea archaeon]
MDNDDLVDLLKTRGVLSSERVEEAFRAVDRADFVPDEQKRHAYEDRPLPIGHDQTISAPHMVAVMTEELAPQEDDTVLEVGTGSGYQAAVLAELVERLITTEIVPALAEKACEQLEGYDNVTVVAADGSTGYEEEAPYDKILFTAAAADLPQAVFDQLAAPGRLVAPVGDRRSQELRIYVKDEDGELMERRGRRVRFVPLTGATGQG